MKVRKKSAMKIRWCYNSRIAARLNVNAIVLYPFVFVKHPAASPELTAHELEHVVQIEREGVIKFYAKYLWFYYKNLWHYRNGFKAYWNIPYEVEARAAEKGLKGPPKDQTESHSSYS